MTVSGRDLLRTRGSGAAGVLVELGLVAIAVACNAVVRWYTLDDGAVAAAHARDVLELQQALGLDWERPMQDAALAAGWVSGFASWFYVWGYLPVLAAALVGLFVWRPAAYAVLRNALLAAGVVGLLCYALYPTAPPRLLDLGYADTVAADGLGATARPVGIANEIAAIPSFHIAYLVVIAVVVFGATRSRALRVACVVEPVLMSWAVVVTGNHWVLDVPAGALLALVGLTVAGRIRDRARRPAGEPTSRALAG